MFISTLHSPSRNSQGYDIAKKFSNKFTHLLPVWYELKRHKTRLHIGQLVKDTSSSKIHILLLFLKLYLLLAMQLARQMQVVTNIQNSEFSLQNPEDRRLCC